MQKPSLYVVATPIGNLQDITLRALDTLKSVDYIISEDSRITSRLLKHYNIEKPQISYRDENKHKAIPRILDLLRSGSSLALTTDSGTPLISDPGFKLVSAVIKEEIPIIPIPGASAVMTSLVASGLPTDKFAFVGFLPRKKSQRAVIIRTYGALDGTLVIFESPYRILKLLEEIRSELGNRYVTVTRELTKIYETKYYGTVEELITIFKEKKFKGEFVVLISKEGFNG